MVKLGAYIRYHQFEHGLRMLEKGYAAARDYLEAEIQRTEAASQKYDEELANGGKWIGAYEDGHLLWDQSQVYQYEIDDVHRALFEVRKAFVIALYHYWEHSVAGWVGKYASHEKLTEYCVSKGYNPPDELNAVRYLANHLKHGPNSQKDWLSHLRKKFPTFLLQNQGLLFGLSEDDLYKVVAVILASGPTEPGPDAASQ